MAGITGLRVLLLCSEQYSYIRTNEGYKTANNTSVYSLYLKGRGVWVLNRSHARLAVLAVLVLKSTGGGGRSIWSILSSHTSLP
jgi:hypothetical protein